MHKKPRWWKRFRPTTRKSKILTGLTSFFAMIGVGAAVALFIAHAGIIGGVTSTPFAPEWASTSPVADQADMTCTATGNADGTIEIHADNAYPGGHCTIGGTVDLKQAGEDGTITGVDLTLPDGWSATMLTGCGADVPVKGNGPAAAVSIQIVMGASADPGGTSTFGATDGVAISPASENAPMGAGCS